MIIKRGDIFYADLRPVVGSEQGGVRPVLIIQNDIGNRHSPTVICAAITSKMNKAKLPTHVEIDAGRYDIIKDSVILLEQLRTIDKKRLKDRVCHLDAEMTRQGLEGLDTAELDLVILENVGNLVCPAEFDTGATKNAMILSVPEGDDKPLKYPLMFSLCDVVLVNKIDVLPYFDFDLEKCREYVHRRNPQAKVIPICARTGEGMEEWTDWLLQEVRGEGYGEKT